jgi:hypothetical protein
MPAVLPDQEPVMPALPKKTVTGHGRQQLIAPYTLQEGTEGTA